MGLLGSNLSVAVGHYRSFLDLPSMRAVINQDLLTKLGDNYYLLDTKAMTEEISFPQVNITGASMNYFESITNTVFRGEVAWFWDEPVLIPEENLPPLFNVTPVPDWLNDFAEENFGFDIQQMLANSGLSGIPTNPQSGTIPTKSSLKYMIGFDKQLWIRPLNRTNTFLLSSQYFGQWWPDYDERMRQGLLLYPSPVDFAAVRETEHVFTGLLNTMYMNGKLTPQIALAYDVRGTWLVQPSINYIWEPFRFMIQYSSIFGNFTNFGAFRDRDQVTFSFTYLLN
jgi:hypothetical protein